ncbi:SRPBCC domain-containing protein [Deinococcus antarcticus]|uniref:SRPBCC domain-containing protein n=1 Tax=Deinococcus antarcticus TaxID=1298767 RepID=A0ABV8AA38_9DEIO
MTSPPRTHEVHIERVLPAPPERVWQAISNPAEVSQWLTPTEMTPGAGGHISHYFENDDHVREGKILIWDEPCTLEYQWIFKGEEPSILRFDLAPHPQGTLLTLRHRLLPTHLTGEYRAGWLAHLDRLEGSFTNSIPDFWERYTHWQKENA